MQLEIGISLGNSREHIYRLALHLRGLGLLKQVFSPMPSFLLDKSLRPESFPYFHFPYKAFARLGIIKQSSLMDAKLNSIYDKWASSRLGQVNCYIGKSGYSLKTGIAAKKRGALYICDRASTHILFQDEILKQEYQRLGLEFAGIDKRAIGIELLEYETADLIFVPTSFVKDTFIAKGVSDDKIRIINYGADIELFKPGERRNEKFIVLYVGAVSVRKGVVYLLQALEDIDLPDIELWLIGPVEKALVPIVGKYRDSFRFMGVKNKKELATIYSGASILVQPSLEEGLSLVILESLSAGTPVIATENTGAGELFRDGEAGYIIKAREADEIREKVVHLYNNRNLVEEMGLKGREIAESHRKWSDYSKEVLRVIEESLAEHR